MAERVEAEELRLKRWLRVRRRIAVFGNRIATIVVILAAFLGITSIFFPLDASVALVKLAMFGVVLAYLLYLAAAFATSHNQVHRFRHVVYQSAAFIVLALSLRAFGLHGAVSAIALSVFDAVTHVRAPTALMNATSVGELAAVMILFILVEIAAFVAQDVDEARVQVKRAGDEVKELAAGMERTARELGDTMREIGRVQLVTSVAQLDPSVMTEAIAITQLWAKRAPNLGGQIPSIAQHCWRILLQTYLQEEQDDFWPKGRKSVRLEGVPRCVRPVGDGVADEHISYFATNVGFYVRYLAALVHQLQKEKAKDQKICVAVVTNVLPAHWWNWPFAADEWRAYTAMENLRVEMRKIAQGGAQVDRVIAVKPIEPTRALSQGPNDLGLWPEELLYEMLANWQILRPTPKPETLSCSAGFRAAQDEIGSHAFDDFPEALRKGAISKVNGARIYPMTTRPTHSTYTTNNQTWTPQALRDAYGELQGSGHYWPLRVTPEAAEDLDGHFDVMFIGLGPKQTGKEPGGVWTAKDIKWGVCLMNSYDAAVETMFLSVISDDSADKEYRWWREKLKQWVAWEKRVLPDAADKWMKERQAAADSPAKAKAPPPVTDAPPGPGESVVTFSPRESGEGRSGPSAPTR